MSSRRELATFGLILGTALSGFFCESLFGGKVLSPADVLFVSASFRSHRGAGADYEPQNRLLMDPVLQFQPWLEFNRNMIRGGRLPLWNSHAGCGTPHLANAQSAVFDPFNLIACFGSLPGAFAWMAAARLWVAGLGMFVLAQSWGLSVWGRWFAGLAFPFCGFLVVWLLYPVTNVAVWMPWLFWATDRVIDRMDSRQVATLAIFAGFTIVGGHIQTSAHVLLAAGVYAVVRFARGSLGAAIRSGIGWSTGIGLGFLLGAVTIVPLAVYLTKSPVWEDRERARPSPLAITKPRLCDAVCTAIPYIYGSQRRGQPNLARALGVHNLNESAGGFAGLATLLWLAPHAWLARKLQSQVAFLAGLTGFGILGAFGIAPVANLLRAAPVLNVMDQRRLTLWVGFGLVLLGGIGLDHLETRWPRRTSRFWVTLWVAAALSLLIAAASVSRAEPLLRARAEDHYARAAGIDRAESDRYHARAERQVRATLEFVPRTLTLAGLELAGMALLAVLSGRGFVSWNVARSGLLALTVCELIAFGYGLNPAIAPEDDRPGTEVAARLRQLAAGSGRVLGLGEEWPPNVAMRYGLNDVRNYDSVELRRNLEWLAGLYEPSREARSSRRAITWDGVVRCRERLFDSGVAAVVAATPPPRSLEGRVERVGGVYVMGLDAAPKFQAEAATGPLSVVDTPGEMRIDLDVAREDVLIVRETFDPGWHARIDGQSVRIRPYRETFLSVPLRPGRQRIELIYDPPEVRLASGVSFWALVFSVLMLAGFGSLSPFRFLCEGLGRSRAVGLESEMRSSPEFSTG